MTQYRDDMTLAELEAFMHSLNELDAAYAAADAQYQITWNNGVDAAGTFDELYETAAAAQADADAIAEDNINEGRWDVAGGCRVIRVEQSMEHLNRIAGGQ